MQGRRSFFFLKVDVWFLHDHILKNYTFLNPINPLEGDFSLPCSVRETQFLHQVRPSGATTLLLANISEKLLTLVKKDLQVSLVVLILVGGLKVSREVEDLDGQDGGLHLR